ncbi:MAG: hypothetical protein BWY31_01708 [Lentisphaerae bacterium ADurb.Bin242]|nr:MAG: hypothetical protein BWY31_01708 [Lentisphaerae bacterium ADurb.Bin242]
MNNVSIEEIARALRKEMSVITSREISKIDPEASLASNGINSMGFIELLLSVERLWDVKLVEAGLSMADVRTVNALAGRIRQEMDK